MLDIRLLQQLLMPSEDGLEEVLVDDGFVRQVELEAVYAKMGEFGLLACILLSH